MGGPDLVRLSVRLKGSPQLPILAIVDVVFVLIVFKRNVRLG
jgi:hypothetical protein